MVCAHGYWLWLVLAAWSNVVWQPNSLAPGLGIDGIVQGEQQTPLGQRIGNRTPEHLHTRSQCSFTDAIKV